MKESLSRAVFSFIAACMIGLSMNVFADVTQEDAELEDAVFMQRHH